MTTKKNNNNKTSIIGSFSTLLQVLFIALKLCGVIKWSWLWVLSPLWISIIVSVIVTVFWLVVLVIKWRKLEK